MLKTMGDTQSFPHSISNSSNHLLLFPLSLLLPFISSCPPSSFSSVLSPLSSKKPILSVNARTHLLSKWIWQLLPGSRGTCWAPAGTGGWIRAVHRCPVGWGELGAALQPKDCTLRSPWAGHRSWDGGAGRASGSGRAAQVRKGWGGSKPPRLSPALLQIQLP